MRIFSPQQGCFMRTKKLQQKSRSTFAKISFAILKFIFKSFLFFLELMLTPRKRESSTTYDTLMEMSENDPSILDSHPPSKRH
jgi:hypothetical protein